MQQEFIENIPEDTTKGVMYIIESYDSFCESLGYNNGMTQREIHDDFIDYFTLLEAYLINKGYNVTKLEFDEQLDSNMNKIRDFFSNVRTDFEKILTKNTITELRNKYNTAFNNSFSYEFTTGELDRIQKLINELRDNIGLSELFTAEHKQRLLRRLEKIQSELHKKVSDLDRFWGLIGDAGVVIGKFGNDAKPIVDRIKEIADIVWRTQSRSEELPSGTTTPFLNSKNDIQEA